MKNKINGGELAYGGLFISGFCLIIISALMWANLIDMGLGIKIFWVTCGSVVISSVICWTEYCGTDD